MTKYEEIKMNMHKLRVKRYESITALQLALGIKPITNLKYFYSLLHCFCDFHVEENHNTNAGKAIEIYKIYKEPTPDLKTYRIGDYSKLDCTLEERKARCVYVIESKKNDEYYIGVTCCLKNRHNGHKWGAENGSQENGASVFRYEDATMKPIFIANENCTKEQLYNIENDMIKYFKMTKRQRCLNIKFIEGLQQSVEGIGVINWDLLCELGVFNRSYVPKAV